MVEGIEFLKILYGEELSNGNQRFLAASDATLNMRRVVAIQVGLLVKSMSTTTVSEDTHDYLLPGVMVGPNGALQHDGGKYLRKAFNATVQMRNKG